MFWNVKKAFDYINSVDLFYKMGYVTDISLLISYIKDIGDLGETDIHYWKNSNVRLVEIRRLEDELRNAGLANDFVSIYDIVNFELKRKLINISEVLFQVNGTELKKYFWNINQEALKIRYPNILVAMENIQLEEENKYSRPYGIRGKVVYKKNKDVEYDLYSGFNPIGLGIKMVEMIDINPYQNIYVWGCNGGYEINGLSIVSNEQKVGIEVYVTDLREFKEILSNTPRRGILLQSNIEYKFDIGLKEFLERVDLQKREETYIYVCESCKENLTILKKFVHDNFLNSNIGE